MRTSSRPGPAHPRYQPDFGPQHILKGASIKADATPEYLGVGYIIGPRVAGVIFAGGVFSWLVLMPLIYFFGKELAHPVYPGTIPVAADGTQPALVHLHSSHGRGRRRRSRTHHLVRTLPTIVSALTSGFKNMRPRCGRRQPSPSAPKTTSPCAPWFSAPRHRRVHVYLS